MLKNIIAIICFTFDKVVYYYEKRIKMKIIINGETKEVNEGSTLDELLVKLNLTGKVMAAAVNMDIVKQDNWKEHKLSDGDKLELLDFVGGG